MMFNLLSFSWLRMINWFWLFPIFNIKSDFRSFLIIFFLDLISESKISRSGQTTYFPPGSSDTSSWQPPEASWTTRRPGGSTSEERSWDSSSKQIPLRKSSWKHLFNELRLNFFCFQKKWVTTLSGSPDLANTDKGPVTAEPAAISTVSSGQLLYWLLWQVRYERIDCLNYFVFCLF